MLLRRFLLALHWALPSLAAIAMYWLAEPHVALAAAVLLACVTLRPIHTGAVVRTAIVAFVLSPLLGIVVSVFLAIEAFRESTWGAIGGMHPLLRFPTYAIFIAVGFVTLIVVGTFVNALIFAPVFALVERESVARQRYRDRTAARIARAVREGNRRPPPFSLYLRPFKTTGHLSSNLVGPVGIGKSGNIQTDFEAILAAAFPAHRPLIALGRPGRLLSTRPEGWKFGIDHTWDIPGTGKVASAERDWRETFARLARHAETIVIIPLNFAGTLEELEFLHRQDLFWKCVFVIPASLKGSRDYTDAWDTVRPLLERAGIDAPPYESSGRLFFLESGSWRSLPSFVTAPLPRATALLVVFALVRRRVRTLRAPTKTPVAAP